MNKTLVEVVDWVRKAKRDFWYQTQMPFLGDRLEDISGADYTRLEEGLRISAALIRLNEAIDKIEKRKVVWRGGGKRITVEKMYLDEPTERGLKNKICNLDGFNLFDVCLCCGGNKWLPAKMNGKDYAMCYNCVPPEQYSSFGAVLLSRSFVSEHMEREKCRVNGFVIGGIPTHVLNADTDLITKTNLTQLNVKRAEPKMSAGFRLNINPPVKSIRPFAVLPIDIISLTWGSEVVRGQESV